MSSWIDMSYGSANSVYDVFGSYKDRFILFETRLGAMFLYDLSNMTGSKLPDPPSGEIIFHDGIAYVFEKSQENCRIKRLCLSSISTSTSNSNNEWEAVGPVLKFFPYRLVSAKNSIYAFGFDDSKIYCYNPRTKELSEISRPIKAISGHTIVAAANRIYDIGEYNENDHKLVSTVHVFDTSSQRWSKASSLPKAIRDGAATTLLDRWIIFSGGHIHNPGHQNYDFNRKIYVFDTFNQQWSESEVELDLPRKAHKIAYIRDHLFCVGGSNDGTSWIPMRYINVNLIIPDWIYKSIKHFILIRKLVDIGRATPIMFYKKSKKDSSFKTNEEKHKVMQRLITNLSLDLFRYVLSFLIHPPSQHDNWTDCNYESDYDSEYASLTDEEWLS